MFTSTVNNTSYWFVIDLRYRSHNIKTLTRRANWCLQHEHTTRIIAR